LVGNFPLRTLLFLSFFFISLFYFFFITCLSASICNQPWFLTFSSLCSWNVACLDNRYDFEFHHLLLQIFLQFIKVIFHLSGSFTFLNLMTSYFNDFYDKKVNLKVKEESTKKRTKKNYPISNEITHLYYIINSDFLWCLFSKILL
jgi:hypothetical protein